MVTFKATVQLLENISVDWFLLENVDLSEDTSTAENSKDTSNLELIMNALERAGPGFTVRVFKVVSSDFGLPQRRVRLYFVGINSKKYPNYQMNNLVNVLNLLNLKVQKPAP